MPTRAPGPWKAHGKTVKSLCHGKWYSVATIHKSMFTPDVNTANAALIADAPALLDALRWALDQLDDSLDPDYRDAFDAATALVARHD